MKVNRGYLLSGCSVAAAAWMAAAAPVAAQTAPANPATEVPASGVKPVPAAGDGQPTGALNAGQAADQSSSDQDIVVTGVRASLSSAQALKQNSNQIVDSVQAQDIGKLPDANTTEALQRITGVQIQRRYGEGATDFDHRTQPAVTIRGLTETLNLLDGRAVFSAAGSRALDLEGIPPELLAGIDVYKNPPAEIVEGGVGGAINLRTRLPFDSPGTILSATAKANYYDRANDWGGTQSGLFSTRFETGLGEMGILVNAVHGTSLYRQDAILVGQQVTPLVCGATGCPSATNPNGTVSVSTAIPGMPTNGKVPLGFQTYDDNGNRSRLGFAGAFQWKPNPTLLFTAQAQYTQYNFNRTGAYFYPIDNYTYVPYNGVSTPVATPQAGAAYTFDSQGYATSGSLGQQTYESGRFDQALRTHTGNYTANLKWSPTEHLKMSVDAQYLKSVYDADRNGLVLSQHQGTGETPYTAANQQVVSFDLRGNAPVWNVSNPAAFTDISKYTVSFIADSMTRNDADQLALAYDIEYDFEGSFLTKLRGGLRYTDSDIALRGTWNGVCLYANQPPSGACGNGTYPALSSLPQLYKYGPSPNFFDGRTLPGGILYPNFLQGSSLWDSLGKTYALLGAQRDLAFKPADITTLNEKTYGAWAQADYAGDFGFARVDGNVGVRVVKTRLSSIGTQFNADGSTAQIQTIKEYTSPLPSVNIRLRPEDSDKLQFRFAYSKAITRPNFDQLSTNLSLGAANQVNPATGHPSASQGNPNLQPVKTDNFDLTAEWYPQRSTSVTAGLFYKKANGFIFSDNLVETYGGRVYDTATSTNSGSGTIKGFEVAYQQFFDFLPGVLSGLGIEANYTYADSKINVTTNANGVATTQLMPLQKLSKHSYNLVGLYEKGPVTARVAWNWRGAYFDTTTGSGANGANQYQAPYATLDSSISFNLTKHLALSLDAVNLLNRLGVTYIDTPSQPLQYTYNDRRFGVSVRILY